MCQIAGTHEAVTVLDHTAITAIATIDRKIDHLSVHEENSKSDMKDRAAKSNDVVNSNLSPTLSSGRSNKHEVQQVRL